VIDGDNAWFMDNGRHRYFRTMVGACEPHTEPAVAGVAAATRSDHADPDRCQRAWPGAASPTRPWSTLRRNIVLAYDSANRVLAGLALGRRKAAHTVTAVEKAALWLRQPHAAVPGHG
jgi:hypothetical protein